jgi:hypothetical protein
MGKVIEIGRCRKCGRAQRTGGKCSSCPPENVGQCIGCERTAELDGGVCQGCLHGKNRGRKWAEMSARVRKDRDFAIRCYRSIPNEQGRKIFEMMYGDPFRNPPVRVAENEACVASVMEA